MFPCMKVCLRFTKRDKTDEGEGGEGKMMILLSAPGLFPPSPSFQKQGRMEQKECEARLIL